MPQTVWIARHGNRIDFVNPAWFNTAERPFDPHLSEDGIIQAQQLAQRLKTESIKHIFVSPFLRTVQTAHEVAEVLDLPLKLEAGLGEWLNPDWMPSMPEKLPPEVLAQKYPRIDLSYQSRLEPRYPESVAAIEQRYAKTIRLLLKEFTEEILLVGHGAGVEWLPAALLGCVPDVNPSLCCVVKLVREGEDWKMLLNGDTSHLTQSESKIRLN